MHYIDEMKSRASKALAHNEPDYKSFIQEEMEVIKKLHSATKSGLKIATLRSYLIDTILTHLFLNQQTAHNISAGQQKIGLFAVGGYGRGHLNPGSDIDILFLLPKSSRNLSKSDSAFTQSVLYVLWDLGLKLGHATRSVSECISEAKVDQQTQTALMDARLIVGSDENLQEFYEKFDKECLQRNQDKFFATRREDIRSRHKKYSYTVFLQEPHIKESCGGLRDYHNVKWLARVKRGYTELSQLVKDRSLTKVAAKAMEDAYDFLHRVRNELHFHTGSNTDILTLQLQGVVATNFKYPEESILRRCESFMRDYYRHTKALHQHTTSLLEIFQIEIEEEQEGNWHSWLTKRRRKREVFDSFISRNGRIYPEHNDIFEDYPHEMMAMFLHCQQRALRLSPQMRKLLKANLKLVDKDFRYSKDNRETFQTILESKGQVAKSLRQMHRVGFLGAYLPEFGAMDCLVQHEFFHRYTADEHTLRCIDKLDELLDSDKREKGIYSQLLRDVEDPYALYLALILHDSGRAENVREHIDGSAMLASQVCNRLQIRGNRRKRIMFLVDHHLTFWRFATTRNLEDPAVIEEFASIMKEPSLLKGLFLFTYADSNGTNDEAWSPWKETLMLQLYQSTLSFMHDGKEVYRENLLHQKEELRGQVKKILNEKYHEEADIHFGNMPDKYFQYRDARNIALHVRAARRFKKNDTKNDDKYIADMRWVDYPSRGYTELVVTCWNRPLLLEKVCCALASEEINIISANVFTRTDHIVCDIFRVSTVDWEAISNTKKKDRVLQTFTKLCLKEEYDSSHYLKRKKNLLRKNKDEGGIPFPVRAYVSNDMSEDYTALNVQALDRIGLLHDLFLVIGKCKLATVNARICTEKGAALDTLYITHPDGRKVTEEDKLRELQEAVSDLLEK